MNSAGELAPMRPTLGDRLRHARQRRFVGRAGEIELFRAMVEAPEPPFAVLFVHGPGGIGKTSLLRAFAGTVSLTKKQMHLWLLRTSSS